MCKIVNKLSACAVLTIIMLSSALAGWQINSQSADSPLTLNVGSSELQVLDGLSPLFPGDLEPDQITLLGTTTNDGYQVLQCRAVYQSLTIDYDLKFKLLDSSSMEMIIEGLNGEASRFVCGNITGTSEQFKQFYTGQRQIEVHAGNTNVPPVLYLPTEQTYLHGFWDGDYSNGSRPVHRVNPKDNFMVAQPPATSDVEYKQRSDGSRLIVKERYVFRYSAQLWDVYQPLTNTPSEFADELSTMVMFDQWGGSGFRYGKFALEWLNDATGDYLDILTLNHGWDSDNLGEAYPDYYQRGVYDEPDGDYGTEEGLQEFLDLGKEFGRIALHCNYMAASDESWSLQEGFVSRALDDTGAQAWYTDMSSIMPLVERQETQIKEDLAPNALFHDQIASGLVINYDAQVEGAGSVSKAREFTKTICGYSKQLHNAPLVSESLASEYLLGEYIDTGDFSIFNAYNRYDFTPEYKLRQLHHLSAFHAMGLAYRHFYPSSESQRVLLGNNDYFNNDEKLDSYRSCEILYGNGAYLFSSPSVDSGLRTVHALTECYTVGLLQKYYLLQSVDYVMYGNSGQWKTLQEVVNASASVEDMQSWYKQFHIRYSNGCNVWVNRDTAIMTVTLPDNTQIELPQNSWAVYTEDGNVIGYTALYNGSRVDYCEDKNLSVIYVNPRDAGSFKNVDKPTVWVAGEKTYELENPDQTLFEAFCESYEDAIGFEKGDIISWFDTGESSLYGIDVTGLSESRLHVIDSAGQVYSYIVTDVFDTDNGQMASYNLKEQMTNSDPNSQLDTVVNMRGLTTAATYTAPYGMMYISNNNTRTSFSTIWGYPEGNNLGEMVWGVHTNIWQLLSSGDISPSARSKVDGNWPSVWTVYSGTLDGFYQDMIYLYPSTMWTGRYDFTASFAMPKALQGVSLGNNNELWVLCQDGEVLRVSSVDGSITDRFFLSENIPLPWGIAYDPKGRLWITSAISSNVYQVAVTSNPLMYKQSDLNRDYYVDIKDFAILSTQWLVETDPNDL